MLSGPSLPPQKEALAASARASSNPDMALRPESVDEWCQFSPNLFEAEGWTVALATEEATLMHSSCSWGGQLLKFELKDLLIEDAPHDPSHVIVRPEVRALHQEQCPTSGIQEQSVDLVAPGEAVTEAVSSWGIVKLCSVLFGDMAGQVMNYFFPGESAAWHQKIRRNYPSIGDSACAFWKDDDESDLKTHECLILVRPTDSTASTFNVYVARPSHF